MCQTSMHPDACDGETGYKGACAGCPFNEGLTEEADQAQGYGCLPSGYDIIQMKQRSGQNWACHSDENQVCAGLCHQAKDRDLDLSQGGLIRYSSWFHAGEQAALDEAATGVLVQEFSGHYFDLALYGNRLADGTREAPTIAHPTLKYYYPEPGLVAPYDKAKDTHRFWAATTAPEHDAETGYQLRRVIGLLEVETSPFDAKVLWMRYVSVAPEQQRRGIAKRLLAGLVKHLQKTGQTLERSSASDEGREKIQSYIDQLLDSHGIRWRQNSR